MHKGIKQLIENRQAKPCASIQGGAWKLRPGYAPYTYELWHYSTPMLAWQDATYVAGGETFVSGPDYVYHISLGHGSASDQNGMNTAFRTLTFNYRYTRMGGPKITSENIPVDLESINTRISSGKETE